MYFCSPFKILHQFNFLYDNENFLEIIFVLTNYISYGLSYGY